MEIQPILSRINAGNGRVDIAKYEALDLTADEREAIDYYLTADKTEFTKSGRRMADSVL